MNLPRIIDMARRREPMSGVVQSEAIVALADEVERLKEDYAYCKKMYDQVYESREKLKRERDP